MYICVYLNITWTNMSIYVYLNIVKIFPEPGEDLGFVYIDTWIGLGYVYIRVDTSKFKYIYIYT